jgi:hypothetical protein
MVALGGGVPDRVPATIHQWQDFHLKTFMGGMTDVEAFRDAGLDAAITRYPFMTPQTPSWKVRESTPGPNRRHYEIETPGGFLSWESESNEYTSWVREHLIKNDDDVDILAAYSPRLGLDRDLLRKDYDALGDEGILRMFLVGYQGGCWQDACELYGTEPLIMATFDKPEWTRSSRSSTTTWKERPSTSWRPVGAPPLPRSSPRPFTRPSAFLTTGGCTTHCTRRATVWSITLAGG